MQIFCENKKIKTTTTERKKERKKKVPQLPGNRVLKKYWF